MAMKFTKYQKSWESERPWLTGVVSDIYKAYCKVCCQEIKIKQNGKEKIKQHEKTSKHIKSLNDSSKQTTLSANPNGSVKLSQSTLQESLTLQQQIAKAEIIQALHVVESNKSFRSTDQDSKRFQKMFPDSKIASGYAMHADKTKYNIVYGLAPLVKEFIMDDVKSECCFSYKFDETTTSKVEKQYDGYITYFSNTFKQVITVYCGSLFVGHCTSKDLLNHFYAFIESLKLSTSWLINTGMDGPTVNQSFLKQLKDELQKNGHTIIDIGSCPLHIANNSFKSVLTVIKPTIDLDLVASDLHFFFKRSAARREDYKFVETITDITTHYMKKHVESRWLSIDKSLVRILEQMENLREYFIVQLPKQKGFNNKNGLAGNERYQRIIRLLKDPKAEIYMSFVVFIAQIFNHFITPLQTPSPMIHRLYPMCMELIHALLGKVIKDKLLIKNGKLVSAKRLKAIDLWKEESQKVTLLYI